jgi:hypothetical protein
MIALRRWLDEPGVKVGIATSVKRSAWEATQIFPAVPGAPLALSPKQVDLLNLFGGAA